MDVPGLALSRSLGDSIAHSVGVINSPDCSVYNLNSGSKYLIVASDGLWNVMTNDEVVFDASYGRGTKWALGV